MCPIHNQPWKTVPAGVSKTTGRPYNSFQVCPIQGCTERPARTQNFAPRSNPAPTGYVKPDRNFDREAYEKTLSIWVAAELEAKVDKGAILVGIHSGHYWELFKDIREEGEKRFATGMDKARAIFNPPTTTPEMIREQMNELTDDAPWPTEENV